VGNNIRQDLPTRQVSIATRLAISRSFGIARQQSLSPLHQATQNTKDLHHNQAIDRK